MPSQGAQRINPLAKGKFKAVGYHRSRARKQARLVMALTALSLLAVAAILMVRAFEDNLVFFYGPSEVMAGKVTVGQKFRLGGLVATGSIRSKDNGLETHFKVSDGKADVAVVYRGLLPDLFREGQGVVAQGVLLESRQFSAHEVLAKHDENYMPAEVVEAMKRAGTWRENTP